MLQITSLIAYKINTALGGLVSGIYVCPPVEVTGGHTYFGDMPVHRDDDILFVRQFTGDFCKPNILVGRLEKMCLCDSGVIWKRSKFGYTARCIPGQKYFDIALLRLHQSFE
jgi:hypothetical protein